jgi:DNA-binding response OmpR family regulator
MAGARRRILVVEDDSETAEELTETLATSGCNEAGGPRIARSWPAATAWAAG